MKNLPAVAGVLSLVFVGGTAVGSLEKDVTESVRVLSSERIQYEQLYKTLAKRMRSLISNFEKSAHYIDGAQGIPSALKPFFQRDPCSSLTSEDERAFFESLGTDPDGVARLLVDTVGTMSERLLQQVVRSKKKLETLKRGLESTVADVQQANRQLTTQLSETMASLSEAESKNQSLLEEIQRHDEECAQLRSECTLKERGLSDVQGQCCALQENLDRTLSKVDQLEKELSMSRQKVEEKEKSSEDLTRAKRALADEAKEKDILIQNLDQAKTRVEQERTALRKKVFDLSKKNETMASNLSVSEAEKATLRSQVNSLSKEIQKTRKNFSAVESENRDLKGRVERLYRSNETLRESLVKSEQEKGEKGEKLGSFQRVFESVSQIFDEDNESEVGVSFSDGSPIAAKGASSVALQNLPGTIQSIISRNKALEKDVKTKQEQLERVKEREDREKTEQMQQKVSLEKKVDSLVQDLHKGAYFLKKEREKEAHLKERVESQGAEIRKLKREARDAAQKNQQKITDYERQLLERDQIIEKLRKESEDQKLQRKGSAGQIRAAVNKLRSEKKQAEEQREGAQNRVEELQKKLDQEKERNQKMSEEMEKVEKDFEKKFQKLKKENDEVLSKHCAEVDALKKRHMREKGAAEREYVAKLELREEEIEKGKHDFEALKEEYRAETEKLKEVQREQIRQLEKEKTAFQMACRAEFEKELEEQKKQFDRERKLGQKCIEEARAEAIRSARLIANSREGCFEEDYWRLVRENGRLRQGMVGKMADGSLSSISTQESTALQDLVGKLRKENVQLRKENKILKDRVTAKNPFALYALQNARTPGGEMERGREMQPGSTPQALQDQAHTLQKEVRRLKALLERYRAYLPQLRAVFGSMNRLLEGRVGGRQLDEMKALVKRSASLFDLDIENQARPSHPSSVRPR